MEKVKRERSVNFTSDERELLVALVHKYKNILENKQSDGATWKQKEKAWEAIEKDFNAQSGLTFRSSKTLRVKYEGLKRSVRKKSAAIRSDLYRTGGGPSTSTPLDNTEIKIKDLICLTTDGLESLYDSDVLPPTQNEDDGLKLSMEEFIVMPDVSEDFDTATESTQPNDPLLEVQNMDVATIEEPLLVETDEKLLANDCTPTRPPHQIWDVSSRRNLKTKKHSALTGRTPKESKNSFEKLTEAKLELIQLQKQLLEEELLEKRKNWEFEGKLRQWKEEEYELKLAKLRKELNE